MMSIVVLGLALSACKSTPSERPAELEEPQNDNDQVEPPPPAAKAPEPAPAAPSSEPPTAAQLPVAEDFQVEATAAIVRANYRHELENLETEMRADGE